LALLGIVFGVVLFVVVIGEWLGLFEAVTARIPWPLSLALVLALGYPVFRKVLLAALKGQVISHTLMAVGAVAAMLAGEWATALVVVFFMRVGDYVERFTAERARRLLKDLTAMAPQTARLEREGQEVEAPLAEVLPGDIVIVRPGEKIPVDGEVIAGHAVVDQSTITGESMPLEAGPGARVFAATLASQGSLKVRTVHAGEDTTFGRLVKLVAEAEANKAEVQRIADRFSAYYLPVVAIVAALTYLIRRDPMATVAVLVVACSCSFALATPIAMLASIGAAAKHGLLIKGGKYLEILDRADVLLIDKTGTLTLGQPQITAILVGSDARLPASTQTDEHTLLLLAASAERYSEHPLAEAVRRAALQRGVELAEPQGFQAYPGVGVEAQVNGSRVAVGNRRIVEQLAPQPAAFPSEAAALEAQGKTLMYVLLDGRLAGVLGAEDTLRPEVPAAIQTLREMGFRRVELLTGDNPRAAAALASQIGVEYRAGLLPEDKIAIVKEYQAQGRKVVMVGDGVNDAPALAQADVGIAMGAAGSDIAVEAAHIALLRDDWSLVPEVMRLARRTLRVVKGNIYFTALYNLLGLTLAALGFLPPILAAAVQSLPDLGILANSSRLLKHR
jgi:Cd2+/Zn2+-exporting ATPase/Cu+-exporting ATPase